MSDYHKSVLLEEVIDGLDITEGKKYIDATLGGGGHTLRILEKGGIVLGLDVDQDAIQYVKNSIKDKLRGINYQNLTIAKGNFRNIDDLARANGFVGVAGILFDLGVSSYQLDTPGRGFSFRFDSELDMRMDQELGIRAMDLLKVLKRGELYELFKNFGEESNALRIATNIVESRRIKPIEKTYELEKIVRRSIKKNNSKINPATKVFQALRIAVNDEIEALNEALPKALSLLDIYGKIAVISFHSLEDRIVKQWFSKWSRQQLGEIITKKPISAGKQELELNSRSRSAKLRIFQKK